jgi:hypothetical protein
VTNVQFDRNERSLNNDPILFRLLFTPEPVIEVWSLARGELLESWPLVEWGTWERPVGPGHWVFGDDTAVSTEMVYQVGKWAYGIVNGRAVEGSSSEA